MPARWFFLVLFPTISALAQQYDLLLRGGHVIDPASAIDAVMDVAISGTQIAAVEAHIPESLARKTVDVTGLHVLPGLVDLHAHVFGYSGSLPPDETALVAGTTTVVDAGGSGWRTFDNMRRTVVKNSKTRVLASINIVGAGMAGDAAESDTADMEPARTAETIKRNRDVIVGVKTAHFARQGWTAIDRAVEAGRLAGVPVMVDDRILTNSRRTTRDKVLDHLRPGDIHTHMYNDRQLELIDRATGEVQPYMREARRRGVLFDLGHGAGRFLWPVASRAMAQGFGPDTISTDVHDQSILVQQPDMPNCMSKPRPIWCLVRNASKQEAGPQPAQRLRGASPVRSKWRQAVWSLLEELEPRRKRVPSDGRAIWTGSAGRDVPFASGMLLPRAAASRPHTGAHGRVDSDSPQ